MDKLTEYRDAISKANERIKRLRPFIRYYEEVIKQAKEDISSCIMHGLISSDCVPYEEYTFGEAVSMLEDSRYMVNCTSKEIRELKKRVSQYNRLIARL
jgi:hypothetical protein